MNAATLLGYIATACVLASGALRAQNTFQGAVQVRIDAAFVEYRLPDVEPLVREQRVTVEALKELWRTGQGRLLAAPSVMTPSGQEAVAKSVTEIIYPTEYTVETAGGRGESGPTNAVFAGKAAAVIPGGFETREIGAILQVIPERAVDGEMINLTFNIAFVRQPEWKSYEVALAGFDGQAVRSSALQPFFPSMSVSTSLNVRNGTTVLAGGGACDGRTDTMVYVLVAATLVDAEGRPLAVRTPGKR